MGVALASSLHSSPGSIAAAGAAWLLSARAKSGPAPRARASTQGSNLFASICFGFGFIGNAGEPMFAAYMQQPMPASLPRFAAARK
jgi:hypothetical protein